MMRPPRRSPRSSALAALAAWACLFAMSGAAAELTLVDGSILPGDLTRWQDGRLEFTMPDGGVSLTAEEVVRVDFAPPTTEPSGTTVELVDGSVLPIEKYTARDGRAVLHLPDVEAATSVSTRLIAAVHLQAPTPAIAAQWRDLREAAEPGDLIVIRKDGAVDHLAGRLGDVTETHVMFFLDDEEFPVERGRVDGLVYYRAQAPQLPEPLCVVRGRDGLKLVAAAVSLEDQSLHVRTTSGGELVVPLERVESADFSGGKIVYLVELAPRSVQTTPLVALPPSAELVARLSEPVMGRGFFAREAQLRHPRYDGAKIIGWRLESHSHAVGLRSKSEVTYQVPDGFRRFQTVAGIDGTLGGRGNVRLVLFGDDRNLWEQAIDGREPPVPVDVDLTGVRRLRILVDYGEEGDEADRLYLTEARFTK